MENPRQMWLPPMFFALSLASSLSLAGGILGAFAPEVLPALAHKDLAYSLIGLGVFLEGWAIAVLISSGRALAAQRAKNAERRT